MHLATWKLVGDRMAKTRLQEVRVTESKFADDVCNHKEGLEQVGGEFITTVVE